MESLASQLVPKAVKKLIPYQSARRLGGNGHIWLNANELENSCQYGDPAQGINHHYNRYPDFLPQDTAQAYQNYCMQVAPALTCETVAVRGADEAIDLLVRTFCEPGNDQIIVCPPTYGMYEFCADAFSVDTLAIPLLENFQLDVQAIKANLANTSLLFLCSPNNPTGNIIAQNDMIELLEASKASTLVVVDEAYIEFAPQSSVLHLMEKYPHLVVIRTLSKAFGLASIRCGFLLASTSVMSYINLIIAPYPMPDPCAEIALKALSVSGLEKMNQQTQALIKVRNWFIAELKELAIVEHVYCSETNFVLIKFNTLTSVYDYLLSTGIVARNQAHEVVLKDCVRITIGSKTSMTETLNALKKFN
ncbi:histidinol-phosphate transaminase [Psychromonas sp. Urea-02u-13]|uniref:histidinol-phosphate transaminase n=1 Tax=Psychromonas sp. Urea-02u-13 TaxID=2058326 RepID=UPI000C32E75E|nr:histidinol-phosphate transaminase [Psychromonas sp. Urea-02u-13]PKG37994.1 histidinol-phosphate transaminase [Psychromonas sp. Urea-02u-13]